MKKELLILYYYKRKSFERCFSVYVQYVDRRWRRFDGGLGVDEVKAT